MNFRNVALFFLIYLIIGFYFTILRSNSHYNTFIIEEDPILKNEVSYWDNRCIEENKDKPGTDWCIGSSGEFTTKKPDKLDWYFFFYSKQPSRWFTTLFFYPFHFLGLDMIHFKGLAGVWAYG